MERMKTTMILPKALWRSAKIRAMDDGIDLSGVVIAALKAYLSSAKGQSKGGKR